MKLISDAQTGAPVIPRIKLTATVRKKVLFPAMFAPEMMQTVPFFPRVKLLQTLLLLSIN
jgi:hypothetical protein